jgi:3-hydroxybutyryl-CoA dehydrogenase
MPLCRPGLTAGGTLGSVGLRIGSTNRDTGFLSCERRTIPDPTSTSIAATPTGPFEHAREMTDGYTNAEESPGPLRVLVIGAGRMGSQIGCEYALAGHTVRYRAPHPDAAEKRISAALDLVSQRDRTRESVPEDFELKVAVLRSVVEASPRAVIATNTSSLSVTKLGGALGAGDRTVGTHYWDPPLLMPLVEVIAGDDTDPAIVRWVADVLSATGKRPVVVGRDVPGFAWNRLQLAILREAVWLVENGVATPETVDTIVRDGLARRWRHVGPFETVGLGGITTWSRIGENIIPALSKSEMLQRLEHWLPRDEDMLVLARTRRDLALMDELVRDRDASGRSTTL